MNKSEFLFALSQGIAALPEEDIARSLDYYCEMIDDRIEDGLSEEEAVAAVGLTEDIIAQIIAETPITRIVKANVAQRRSLRAWEIVLIVLGSPVWIPLLIAAAAVIFAAYIVIWSFIIVMYAVVLSFAAAAILGIVTVVPYILSGHPVQGALHFGVGLFCAGLTILSLIGTLRATRWTAKLCKNVYLRFKSRAAGRGGI